MPRMPDPNAPECECYLLEQLAKEPTVPIAFDPERNDYSITTSDGGSVQIYHCFFCGGRVPQSRRDSLFHHITHDELHRLQGLTKHVNSVVALEAAFGKPDCDSPNGYAVTRPEAEGSPRTDTYRVLTYDSLSPVASVDAIVRTDGTLQFAFLPKPRDRTSS